MVDTVYQSVYNEVMKNDNSRETILDCALHLFSAKGYEAVGISEIVDMAGIKKPTLYYFFGSKEGLFKELLITNYDILNDALSKSCRYHPNTENYFEDIHPVLLAIANTYFTFAKEHSEFYLLVLALSFAPPTSASAKLSEDENRVQYITIEQVFHAISLAHPNIKGKEQICSWRFLAMINAQIGFWNRGYGTLDSLDAESIVTLFMHGIFS